MKYETKKIFTCFGDRNMKLETMPSRYFKTGIIVLRRVSIEPFKTRYYLDYVLNMSKENLNP